MTKITELTVNKTRHAIDADEERSLLSVLRDDLDLTGTKYGCGEAQCGACIVLIDGARTPSCTLPVGCVGTSDVTTIEGLERDGQLHPVQQAFLEMGAFQCGYCTPGMIMASVALLRENPDPSDAQIQDALQTNICRCGTYPRIVAAVRRAAEQGKGQPA